MAVHNVKYNEFVSYVESYSANVSDELAQEHFQKNVEQLDDFELKDLVLMLDPEPSQNDHVVDDSEIFIN